MSYRQTTEAKSVDEANKGHEAYEEYLLLLQQRNRLLKKLKEKDEKQLNLEKKEQGFSLYLNGANVGLHLSGNHRPRKSKTAGDGRNQTVVKDSTDRVKTAPEPKLSRKCWNESPPDKIKIKTKDGDKLVVDLPEVVSGNYEEDFEVYQSFLQTKLEEEEGEEEDRNERRTAGEEGRKDDSNEKEEDDGDEDSDDDGEMDHQLTFTVDDLKTLRASLEKDSSICRSIAEATEDTSSDEDGSSNEDGSSDEDGNHRKNNTACELQEIEEEVEESLDMSLIMTSRDISEEILNDVHDSDQDEEEDADSDNPHDSNNNNSFHSNNSSNNEGDSRKDDDNENGEQEDNLAGKKLDLCASQPMFKLPSPKTSLECVQLHGAAPKNRPITASRKRTDESKFSVTSSVMSDDLASAIEEENRQLSEYKEKRNAMTAPESRNPTDDTFGGKDQTKERPQTIANPLSDGDISSITERVRKMTGRQQRRLLRMLAELEIAEKSQQDVTDWNIENDSNEKYLKEKKNKRNLQDIPVAFVNTEAKLLRPDVTPSFSEPLEASESKHQLTTKNISSFAKKEASTEEEDRYKKAIVTSPNKTLKVLLQFISNWGNEDFIGLTEVQFTKSDNEEIHVRSRDVRVASDHQLHDDVKTIVNGKMKTTKGRNMWTTGYVEKKPVEISLKLNDVDASDVYKIIIWNYNKSLQELNIGVKECRIWIDDQMVWQGIIDKGCGNQIFDYSKTISLKKEGSRIVVGKEEKHEEVETNEPEKQTSQLHDVVDVAIVTEKIKEQQERPGTRTTDKSGLNTKKLPVIDIPPPDKTTQQRAWSSPREASTTDNKKSKQTDKCSSPSSGKPLWLSESVKVKQQSQQIEEYIDESLRPRSRSRPSSGRRSQAGTPEIPDDTHKQKHPSSGRRSQSSTPDITEDCDRNKKELDQLFDLNAMPRRFTKQPTQLDYTDIHKSLSEDHQPAMINMPSKEEEATESISERHKFKKLMDVNLEQSLRSIDNFNFHHLGRITGALTDDEDFGSFLEPMKEKDIGVLNQKLESDHFVEERDDEDEEDEFQTPDDSPRFELPYLPEGKELIINIKSTWGDRHYVGLNGIEVFTDVGTVAPIRAIRANPKDINILPEYEGDPRVVENLVDGCYLTRDDLHLWLTPYTSGSDHLIAIEFERQIAVAMIRVWNYNKSRIHSSRGARFVEMALDGKLIFLGEIARASGVLSSEDPYGDMILFTVEDDVLKLVAKNDKNFEMFAGEDEDQLAASFDLTQRPSTANDESGCDRPFTAPKSRENSRDGQRQSVKESEDTREENVSSPESDGFMECQVLCVFLTATWGDHHYLGLTGLEVLGETFEALPLKKSMMEASPRDLNDLDDYNDDDRTLDKLINNVNVTTSDENMWMIPFDSEGIHFLKVAFDEPTIVTGIRVWNYNKSLEDTFRGAKTVHIFMDETEVSPEEGYLVRKGPGHIHFDYAQDIYFQSQQSHGKQGADQKRHRKVNLQKIVNEYETIMMPCGFVFQFRLFSSWGDQYYIGLNGLEVYDQHGELMTLTDNNITAFPHSVNVLTGVVDDVRTPDKLVDGVNNTHDGRHMWMAPIFPEHVNIIYVVFDEPVTVSMIKLWNYSKTPSRGARQFALLVDDLLVYSGVLPQPALFSRGIVPGVEVPVMHHTILFTDAEEIVLKEKKFLLSSSLSIEEQGVTLTNDKSVLKTHKDKYAKGRSANQAKRPMTSCTGKGKQ